MEYLSISIALGGFVGGALYKIYQSLEKNRQAITHQTDVSIMQTELNGELIHELKELNEKMDSLVVMNSVYYSKLTELIKEIENKKNLK